MAEPRYDRVTEFALSLFHRRSSSAPEPSAEETESPDETTINASQEATPKVTPILGPYRTAAEVAPVEAPSETPLPPTVSPAPSRPSHSGDFYPSFYPSPQINPWYGSILLAPKEENNGRSNTIYDQIDRTAIPDYNIILSHEPINSQNNLVTAPHLGSVKEVYNYRNQEHVNRSFPEGDLETTLSQETQKAVSSIITGPKMFLDLKKPLPIYNKYEINQTTPNAIKHPAEIKGIA